MQNRRILLLVIGILFGLPLSAQQQSPQDSLEQEILAHTVTDGELLAKSRAVLLESFKAADTAKARKVLRYIDSRFDRTKTITLYPSEELLVFYLLGDFQKVLSFARTVDSGEEYSQRAIVPDADLFYDDMIELSRREEIRLREKIRESNLAPHERDFVALLLRDILGQDQGDELQHESFQRRMNEEADDYLATYTDSEYNPYIRNYIRFVWVESVWGYGFGLSLGYLGLPNALSIHLGDYALFSFNFEGAYGQAYMNLGVDIGLAHDITKGFEYDGSWPAGLSVMLASGILSFGPMLEFGEGFLAIPTAGISYMNFAPPEKEKEEMGVDVSMGFAAWALGVSFRIPVGGEGANSFITINAGYRTAITNIELAKGGYTFVNIGFGIFGRPLERDL